MGLADSLRKKSYNKMLLRAIKELLHDEAKLEIFDIQETPLFNQDIELQMPEKVKSFKSEIEASNADFLVSTEYS